MAQDNIRYSVSMDFIDEYNVALDNTGEDGSPGVTNTNHDTSRHHPTFGGSKGGSGKHDCNLTTVDQSDIIASSATSLGTMTSVQGVCIKHSGYTSAARTAASTATLSIIMGSVTIAVIEADGALVLPFATATTPVITATSSSGNICVEVSRST